MNNEKKEDKELTKKFELKRKKLGLNYKDAIKKCIEGWVKE